jgi:CHAD domain-containing protein
MAVAGRVAPAKPASARRRGWQVEPAGEVAVRLARRHLDAASEAVERLAADADAEALHDFRVALRRLRSVLRAYRPCLRKLPKKLRRDLKRVVRATGDGRDAEVFLEWIDAEPSFPAVEHSGREWVRRQLVEGRDEAYKQLRSRILADFTVLARRLHRALVTGRDKTSYGEFTALRLHAQVAALSADLARVHSAADSALIHDARIQAKRLRYLIEPLVRRMPVARAAVKRLKAFQDETGSLCDGFVRRRMLGRTAEAAGARQARAAFAGLLGEALDITVMNDVMPGLMGMARRNQRQVDRQYRHLHDRYLATHSGRWLASFARLERQLRPTRGG